MLIGMRSKSDEGWTSKGVLIFVVPYVLIGGWALKLLLWDYTPLPGWLK
jgi:hypothetical protein